MAYENRMEQPEQMKPEASDSRALDNRLQEAADVRPGTWRCNDSALGGDVLTSVSRGGGMYSEVQAKVYGHDGSGQTVGTARFSVSGESATIHNQPFVYADEAVKHALVSEISEQARTGGATVLRGWAPDGDQEAVKRWQDLGLQPTERTAGAAGVSWERPL